MKTKKIISTFLLFFCILQTTIKAEDVVSVEKSTSMPSLITIGAHAVFISGFLYPPCKAIYDYANLKNKIKTKCKKIEQDDILSSLKDFAKKVTDKKLNFYIGNCTDFGMQYGTPAFSLGDKIIVITPEYYTVIEKLFNGEMSEENKEKTLKILEFLIQHEATHLKNGDHKYRVIRSAIGAAAKIILFEAIQFALSKKTNEFIDQKAWIKLGATYIIPSYVLNVADALINSYLNKQQEYRADAGVVGDDAMSGGKQLFTNIVNLIQNNPQAYALDNYNLSHPSSANRLKHLEARTA